MTTDFHLPSTSAVVQGRIADDFERRRQKVLAKRECQDPDSFDDGWELARLEEEAGMSPPN